MSNYERDVLQLMDNIINTGNHKGDRTGTGTHSKFANVLRVDIRDGKAPLPFSKQLFNRSYIWETLWFLTGSTNIRMLKDNNVGIWDEWVTPKTAEFQPLTAEFRASKLHKKLPKEKANEIMPHDGHQFNTEYTDEEIDQIAVKYQLDDGGRFRALSDKDLFNFVRCRMEKQYGWWQTLLHAKKVQNDPQQFRDFITNNNFWGQIEEVKLVAGDIGVGAYGKMWRDWEDTRIVDKSQEQEYYNRGYQFVVDIPHAANWARGTVGAPEDHVVVHRRIDQIAEAIKLLKNNPDSRRIIVTAWNPGRIDDAVLPPCHSLFSFYTANRDDNQIEQEIFKNHDDFLEWAKIAYEVVGDKKYELGKNPPEIKEALYKFAKDKGYRTKKLSCVLYQRSSDTCLGLPFNVAQYVLLTNMIAQVVNMATDEFVLIAADSHIYDNHVELAKKQITCDYVKDQQPRFELNPNIKNIDDFKFDDIRISGYEGFNPPIPYPVAV